MGLRVGTVCYATDQGIGVLPKQFYDHGVITNVLMFRHGRRPDHPEWYPQGTPLLIQRPFTGPDVEGFLARVDVLLQFETPFDWAVLKLCKDRGVRTAICCMHECTPAARPYEPDLWICPSKLDQQYFPGSPFLPVPVDRSTWRQRTRATRFLHNGGNLGLRGHKGTREILQAWRHVRSSATLTVRAQDTAGLGKLLQEVGPLGAGVTVEPGEVPRDRLFDGHDVFLMAEKYNGLSLPLQEARAAGMVVMTSDRFPMNDWLPREALIPAAGTSRQRVGGGYLEYDEARVEPEAIAARVDEWYGRDISAYSLTGTVWAEANSWEVLKPRWLAVLEALCVSST